MLIMLQIKTITLNVSTNMVILVFLLLHISAAKNCSSLFRLIKRESVNLYENMQCMKR